MAIRKIVRIDEEKCDGCGDCVPACAEGAIKIINGKAKVIDDRFCDGMGACLGECPLGAITIEEREAAEFDEKAVEQHLAHKKQNFSQPAVAACPGSALRTLNQTGPTSNSTGKISTTSQLRHWPVKLSLVPSGAPFLKDANLLICADCVPFTVPDFHDRYLKDRSVVVGCPKLDDLSFYYEKIKQIFSDNPPRKITVLIMEVPCCSGLAQAVIKARNLVNADIPLEIHTIGIRGNIRCQEIPLGKVA